MEIKCLCACTCDTFFLLPTPPQVLLIWIITDWSIFHVSIVKTQNPGDHWTMVVYNDYFPFLHILFFLRLITVVVSCSSFAYFLIGFFCLFVLLQYVSVVAFRISTSSSGIFCCSLMISCSTACQILVSRPGIQSGSPALQGRFLTTGLPGKSPRA